MKGSLPILIVEDQESGRTLFRDSFLYNQIKNPVVFASDGNEAFDYLATIFYHPTSPQNRLPGVIILNHSFRESAALDCLSQIKKDPVYHQIPVVILSESSNADNMGLWYSEGCNGYFTRPLNKEEFHRVVKVIYDFWLDTASIPYFVEKV